MCTGLEVDAQSWRHSVALEYHFPYVPKWNYLPTKFNFRQGEKIIPDAPAPLGLNFYMGISYEGYFTRSAWFAAAELAISNLCYICASDQEFIQDGWPSRSIPQMGYYTEGALFIGKRLGSNANRFSIRLGPSFRGGSERYFLGSFLHASGTFWDGYYDTRLVRDWGVATRISYDRIPKALTELSRIPWHKHLGWSVWTQARYYFVMSRLYWTPVEFVTGAPTTFSLGVSLRYYFGARGE